MSQAFSKSLRAGRNMGSRTMPPTGTLPTKKASSPICTTLSPTACVMLVAAMGKVPPRFSRTASWPCVSFWIASSMAVSPFTEVTVATAL
ncbi:hypothetical protein D9M68_810210 [compost metagenome]